MKPKFKKVVWLCVVFLVISPAQIFPQISNDAIVLTLDSTVYTLNEYGTKIRFTIHNGSDSTIYFWHCADRNAYYLQRKENENWVDKGGWGNICLAIYPSGYTSLFSDSSYVDVAVVSKPGTYRLIFLTGTNKSSLKDSLISNEFIVTENSFLHGIVKKVYTDKEKYVYGEKITITIRAINTTQDTMLLVFPDGCQAFPFIDTVSYLATFGLGCYTAIATRKIPPMDSVEWIREYPHEFSPTQFLSVGKHKIYGYFPNVSFPHSVTDTIEIEVQNALSNDKIKVEVSTDKTVYKYGDTIAISVKAHNLTADTLKLRFSSSCQVNYIIDDFNFYHNILCAAVLTGRIILPFSTVEWGNLKYPMYNSGWPLLSVGSHNIIGEVLKYGKSDTITIIVEEVPNAQNYFPLQVGNNWTYSGSSDTLSKRTYEISSSLYHISGQEYYLYGNKNIDSKDTIRKDESGNIWKLSNGLPVLWFDFMKDSGEVYTFKPYSNSLYTANVLVTKNLTVKTHNGTYSNCVRFDFDIPEIIDDEMSYTFAEGIGIIKRFGAWSNDLLFSAIIDGSPLSVDENLNSIPASFVLKQNYPNPFNPTTIIEYFIPKEANVSITIFDMLGRKIKTLVNEKQNSGEHKITLNAENLPSGMYFYRLDAGGFSQTKKLLLLR